MGLTMNFERPEIGAGEIRALGCPAGLGEPVFDKLNADFAKAVMCVGAVKGELISPQSRALSRC